MLRNVSLPIKMYNSVVQPWAKLSKSNVKQNHQCVEDVTKLFTYSTVHICQKLSTLVMT